MKVVFLFALTLALNSPLHAITGDLNADNTVDFADFLLFAANFGAQGEADASRDALAGDSNCDKTADFSDFLTFAQNFGMTDTGTDSGGDTSLFHGPRTFAQILSDTRDVSWTPLTGSLTDLSRFSRAIEGSNDLVAIDDSDNTYAAGVTVGSG